MAKIDPHNYPGPIEELEKFDGKYQGDKKRTKLVIILALISVFVAGLGAYFAFTGVGVEEFIEDLIEDGGILSMIPLWLIIFIPFAFAKKKKPKK